MKTWGQVTVVQQHPVHLLAYKTTVTNQKMGSAVSKETQESWTQILLVICLEFELRPKTSVITYVRKVLAWKGVPFG